MTLDFKKLIVNAVKKQMAVQHFECNVQIFKKEELPEGVVAKLTKAFGDSFLLDANYTLWFSGNNITKETVEKTLFKIANKAMGEAANNMNESDLKLVDLGNGTTPSAPQETSDDVDSMTSPDADAANAEAITGLVGSGDEAKADAADDGTDPEAAEIVADEPEPVTDEEIDSVEDGDEREDADIEPVTDEELGDDDDGDSDDDDEEEEDLDESVESPAAGEKFVLLKITMK
jgi:hypothetical protein